MGQKGETSVGDWAFSNWPKVDPTTCPRNHKKIRVEACI